MRLPKGKRPAAGRPVTSSLVHSKKSGGSGAIVAPVLVLLVIGGILLFVLCQGNEPPPRKSVAQDATTGAQEHASSAEAQVGKKKKPVRRRPVVKEHFTATEQNMPETQQATTTPIPQEEPEEEEEEPEPEEEPAEDVEEEETPHGIADDSPEAVARFEALLQQHLADEDYEGLRDTLRAELETQYPGLFDVKVSQKTAETVPASAYAAMPSANQLKVKGKPASKALAVYYCLSLLTEDSAPDAMEKPFMTFLLTDKRGPAEAFFKGLSRKKVPAETAAEMMAELRTTYAETPKRAFRSIAPLTASADKMQVKKYYPVDKKVIEKEIANILKTRPSHGADEAQQEAINLSNVYRYICGVPPSLKYDKTFGEQAEKAAAACERAGCLSHDLGDFTDVCNLCRACYMRVETVSSYMNDHGLSNREQRKHRYWVLDASAAKVAFGQSGTFHAMRVLDHSCTIPRKGAYSYPGRGFFPSRYLHGDGWSYYTPPGVTVGANPKVEMWCLSRSPKKRMTDADLHRARPIAVSAVFPNGNYLVFEPDYNDPLFRRNKSGQITGIYWVRVSWSGFMDEYVVELY
ncbi:MAG: hypothetical protein IKV92_09270 [Akkermansia sp.]|nr:hypothetical protein [Akkermansia sp.]